MSSYQPLKLTLIGTLAISLSIAGCTQQDTSQVQAQQPSSTTQSQNFETNTDCTNKLRSLTQQTYTAWSTRTGTPDYKTLSRLYTQGSELVMYDPQPPLEGYTGWNNVRQGLQRNVFNNVSSLQLTMNKDFRAWCRGDVAWTTFTNIVAAVPKNGQPSNTTTRQSNVWERQNGCWVIVHEHASAPLAISEPTNR